MKNKVIQAVIILSILCIAGSLAWGKKASSYLLEADRLKQQSDKASGKERLKMLEKAKKLCAKAIKTDPELADTYILLGEIYMRLEDDDKALKAFRIAKEKAPKDISARRNSALIFIEQGKLKDALEEIKQMTEVQPDFIDGFYLLGVMHSILHQYEQAKAAFEKVVGRDFSNPKVHLRIAKAYETMERLDEAKNEYLWALKFDPDNDEAAYRLGWVYVNLGKTQDALRLWTKFWDRCPRCRDSWGAVKNDIAYRLFKQGEKDKARQIWKEVLSRRPNSKEAKFMLK